MRIVDYGKLKDLRVYEFSNVTEFVEYLKSTPVNTAFANANLQSEKSSEGFTGTASFEEAMSLLKFGWQTAIDEFKSVNSSYGNKPTPRQTLGVAGYAPCVPAYLNNVPNAMVTKKMVVNKQPIVDIVHTVCYHWRWEAKDILKEGKKVLSIVKAIESQGKRCRLHVAYVNVNNTYGTKHYWVGCKVCIKEPNERLNISKVSFALANPSMLRRIFLKFVEVCPEYGKGFNTTTYGSPVIAPQIAEKTGWDIIGEVVDKETMESLGVKEG